MDGNGRRNSGHNGGGVSKPGTEQNRSNITHKPNQGELQEVSAKAPKNDDQAQRSSSSGHRSEPTQAQPNTGVADITDQFDYTFWAGDLNYRVDLTRAEAEECLQRGDLEVKTCSPLSLCTSILKFCEGA